MDLVITGLGRYVDKKRRKEVGLIVLNDGLLILPVEDEHLAKLVPYFSDSGKEAQSNTSPPPPPDEDPYYVDPTFITDEQAQYIAQRAADDNEYSEDTEVDEEGIGAY